MGTELVGHFANGDMVSASMGDGEMAENLRFCKKCLTRDMMGQEKVYETLKRYIEDIEESDRTPKEKYEERLGICKECERLISGMCQACGCYVELRAATVQQECPYEKWKEGL